MTDRLIDIVNRYIGIKFVRGLLKTALYVAGAEVFICPVCGYKGPFLSVGKQPFRRKHAMCPGCMSLERHRLLYLALEVVFAKRPTEGLSVLHFAPEPFMESILRQRFQRYVSADLYDTRAELKEDISALTIKDEQFDVLIASHVLEHIENDRLALSEISRVIKKPGGVAILPVPVIGDKTVEYKEPNPYDGGHVRCPGQDYFERYREFFSSVKLYTSDDFESKYQLYIYENREDVPRDIMPDRPAVEGEKHIDVIPVCYS